MSLILFTSAVGCSNQAMSCESDQEALNIANMYIYGRADKLQLQNVSFEYLESEGSSVTYLGNCVHVVESIVFTGKIGAPRSAWPFKVVIKRNRFTNNWKLKQLNVFDEKGESLLSEEYDL